MLLYKYFQAKWAIETLKSRLLKVSTLSELNDPFEWTPGVSDIENRDPKILVQQLGAYREKIGNQAGMVCFSARIDDPVMWAHYAENHAGIALGFDYLDDPEERSLAKVNYSSDRVCIDEEILFSQDVPDLERTNIMRKVLTTKHVSWQYEQEYRVLIPLFECTPKEDLYFIQIPEEFLTKVILGFRCNNSVDEIQEYLEEGGYSNVEIIRARQSLECFEVLT